MNYTRELDAYLALRATWNQDPERYCVERLGLRPTRQQRELCEAIAPDGARVSVRSGQNTGKDGITAGLILWFLECKDYPRVPCTAPTAPQLYSVLWAEIAKWIRKSRELSRARGDAPRLYLDRLFRHTQDRVYDISAPRDWFAVARTTAAHTPANLQGFHASDITISEDGEVTSHGQANFLFVLDEASGIPDTIAAVVEGALASPGSRELQIGNPNSNHGFFAVTHQQLGHLYTLLHWKSQDSELCDPKFRERLVAKFGEDSDAVRVRADGEFPKADPDTLIPFPIADAARTRGAPERPSAEPLKLGIDPAGQGSDRAAFVLRKGPVVPYIQGVPKSEPMELVGIAVQIVRAWDVDELYVDDIGIGAGVYSRLLELKREGTIDCVVTPVGASRTAPERQFDEDEQARLMRDYLWLEMRRWFRDNAPALTCDDELARDLVGEISSIKRLPPDSKGFSRVESKKEYKARVGRSPDFADALGCTFAPPQLHDYSYEAVDATAYDEGGFYGKGAL